MEEIERDKSKVSGNTWVLLIDLMVVLNDASGLSQGGSSIVLWCSMLAPCFSLLFCRFSNFMLAFALLSCLVRD